MNADIIDDLKQFIAAAISQQTSDLHGDITEMRGDITGIHDNISGLKNDINGIRVDIKRLDNKIDDLSASVANAIEASNDAVDEQLVNHDQRLSKLEHLTT